MVTEIRNGRVKETFLGREDHGMFIFCLTLDYGPATQGFGLFQLDAWNEQRGRREGTRFGMESIIGVLETLGVESWEDLCGTPVRARLEDGIIRAIGHYLEDRWFDNEALWQQIQKEDVPSRVKALK